MALLPTSHSTQNATAIRGALHPWAYAQGFMRYDKGASVTALDASPTLVEITKQRLKGNAEVYLADLEQPLDFLANKKFNIIIAPLLIHYIKDWLPLFSNLSELLIDNGLFVFSTHSPHTEFYLRGLDNYYEKTLITDHWKDIGTVHFYHHTLQELTESLRQAGFLINQILEPTAGKEMQTADPDMFKIMSNKPWFLFVKAVKGKFNFADNVTVV